MCRNELPVLRLSDRDWHKMAKYANFVGRRLILLSDPAKSSYWLGNNFVLRRIFVWNIHRLELNEWRGVNDQNAETKAPCYLFISGEYQAARFSGNKPRKTKEITKLSPQLSPSLHENLGPSDQFKWVCSLLSGQPGRAGRYYKGIY